MKYDMKSERERERERERNYAGSNYCHECQYGTVFNEFPAVHDINTLLYNTSGI